jgi:hypothetical protein
MMSLVVRMRHLALPFCGERGTGCGERSSTGGHGHRHGFRKFSEVLGVGEVRGGRRTRHGGGTALERGLGVGVERAEVGGGVGVGHGGRS